MRETICPKSVAEIETWRIEASHFFEMANEWLLFLESRTSVSNFRSDSRKVAFLSGSLLSLVMMSHPQVE